MQANTSSVRHFVATNYHQLVALSRTNVGTLRRVLSGYWEVVYSVNFLPGALAKILNKTKLWMPCTRGYNLSGYCLCHILVLSKQFFPGSLGLLVVFWWTLGGAQLEVKFIEAFDDSAKLMCCAISSDWHVCVLKQFGGSKVVGWYFLQCWGIA